MNQTDLLRLFYPMVAGYGVSKFCKMGKSGVNIKFRPPPYVFGIVWPILYILLGLSWIHSNPSQNRTIELLYIILKDFGTEKRNDKLLDFRYKYRGIMDRFPIMIDAWGMLPEHPKEFGSTSNHKRISECYRKFLLAEKEIIDRKSSLLIF